MDLKFKLNRINKVWLTEIIQNEFFVCFLFARNCFQPLKFNIDCHSLIDCFPFVSFVIFQGFFCFLHLNNYIVFSFMESLFYKIVFFFSLKKPKLNQLTLRFPFFRWCCGVFGKKTNKIPKITGTTMNIHGIVSYCKNAPHKYTNNIPAFLESWEKLPSRPRTLKHRTKLKAWKFLGLKFFFNNFLLIISNFRDE